MRRSHKAAGTVLALLALAACGGEDPQTPGPSAPEEPGASLGLTAPGTVLDIGETARVPLPERTSADGEPNVVDLTLTSISEGDPSLVEGLPGTPYFARLTFTAVSGDAQRFFPANVIVAWSGDTQVLPLASPAIVDGCARVGFTAPEPPLGSSIDTCVTFVVEPGGAPLDRIGYDDNDTYDDQEGTAVEWR
ncbi:MAG: hypothetical protein ACO1ON_11220 [Nocardioides sp.]